jgi:hypothetical protein
MSLSERVGAPLTLYIATVALHRHAWLDVAVYRCFHKVSDGGRDRQHAASKLHYYYKHLVSI